MRIHSTDREERERLGVNMIFRLFAAQAKEETSTMLKFEGYSDDPYSIKIIEDRGGFLTCTIRLRKSGTLCYTIRFRKKPKLGVIYNFWDACRLNRLYVEEDLFHDLLVKP